MEGGGPASHCAVTKWDERYAAATYFYGTEPNDFLKEHVAAIPAGGRVLCLGEGEGRNATYLAGLGFDVVALDQSLVGLQKAARLAAARSVSIRTLVANLDDYQFEADHWDGIISIWCHVPKRLRSSIHGRIGASLKPGGAFLLESYTAAQLRHGTGGPKDLDFLPSLTEISADLAGMKISVGQELERVVQEGAGHAGLSAVVQVVAQRVP